MLKSLEIINKNKSDLISYEAIVLEKNEVETIKSDLEVLEILRKHYKDIKVRPRISNMKDLQKLKQWFKSNKVGDHQ